MEFSIIAVNVFYAVLGLALLFLAFWIFDNNITHINLKQELRNGNIAVAIFFAALFISFALIITGALN